MVFCEYKLSLAPRHTNPILPNETYAKSGCEKREVRRNWSMVISEKVAPVTGTALRTTGPALADSRQ